MNEFRIKLIVEPPIRAARTSFVLQGRRMADMLQWLNGTLLFPPDQGFEPWT